VVFLSGVALVIVTKALFIGWGVGDRTLDFTGISGHAMLSAAIFPTAVYLVLHRRSLRARWAGAVAAALIALAVATSRVLLNAHSISEVVSGVGLGFLISAVFLLLSRRLPDPHLRGRVLLIVFGLLVVLLYGQRLPTQHWIREAALSVAGRERPFIREVWQRDGLGRHRCQGAHCRTASAPAAASAAAAQ
jgi:membrane-associated phospholipid phosphatase